MFLTVVVRDTAARFGGDEFAALQAPTISVGEAQWLAGRLTSVLSAPYLVQGRRPGVGASIGVAFAPFDAVDPDVLRAHADITLHRAKRDPRSALRFASSNDVNAGVAPRTA
ncbi:diguanylate cyclase domain-containing protein [Lichenibacterium dinghuense]|uniref:diguanylate cyclase domain-containing protein n=1 Tax=Lichenibacterium dinghuense TaxID=2895977 RepID=UPI001F39B478|nr:diguanylate cyclase [Lichenibacterium sp. 6Y81]